MKQSLKKLGRFLHSMQFAIALLLLICAACLVGSLLPQNTVESYYYGVFGENLAPIALALSLDDIFRAPWFVCLVALLCLNLSLCSILRFPMVLRKYRGHYTLENCLARASVDAEAVVPDGNAAKQVFAALGMQKITAIEQVDAIVQYACKGKLGVWGAWVTHVGMLMVVLGFAAGQMLTFEAVVYGVPGVTKPIEGTEYQLTIDDFDIALRDDFTVEQYTASLTVTDANGEMVQGTAQVNHPMDAFGMRIYQNSTGWASNLSIYHKEELLSTSVLYAGENIGLQDLPIVLVFHAFFPDYVNTGAGPSTRTPLLNNPAALFSLYYDGQLLDMNVVGIGYGIEVGDYRFVFENPRQYTLLQIAKDPSIGFVFVGGMVLLVGLYLSFYVRAREVWSVEKEGEITLYAHSEKGASLFAETFHQALDTGKENPNE